MSEPPRRPRLLRAGRTLEELLPALGLLAMAVLPLAEIAARRLAGRGIPGQGPIVQHLTLWVGFLGAALAAREGKHLALATVAFLPERARAGAAAFAGAVGAAVSILLARASLDLVLIERAAASEMAIGIPT